MLQPPRTSPPPPTSLLNVVNNRNGVISAAPREMAPQLWLLHLTSGRAGGGEEEKIGDSEEGKRQQN